MFTNFQFSIFNFQKESGASGGGLSVRRKAFTLIELIIYVGIFAIAAIFLTNILIITLRVQTKESSTNAVNKQLNFVLDTVQRLVRSSSEIECVDLTNNICNTNTVGSYLKLRFEDTQKDPTCIYQVGDTIKLAEGSDPANKNRCTSDITKISDLTNPNQVKNVFIQFTKSEVPGGHALVQVDASMTYNSTNPQLVVTRSISSVIGRVSAATFDSNILPNAGTLDVGQSSGSTWNNGFFSGNVTVGGQLTVSGGCTGCGGGGGGGGGGGPILTGDYSDVSASRSVNTEYQNGAKSRLVIATLAASNTPAYTFYIGPSNPSNTVIAQAQTGTHVMTVIVPANYWYKISSPTGFTVKWLEKDLNDTGGSGTVTSVGLSLPSIFSVSGSPVTGSGTLTGTLASQTANQFFAAPNGAAGVPSFRGIVAADIPTLNQNTTGTASNVTGIVGVANGGTGASTLTANSVILGNGTSPVTFVAPGNAGNVLTSSNGTWTSAPPAGWTDDGTVVRLTTSTDSVGIGDTTPASLLTVGNGDLFQVNSSGDLIKVDNVTYDWPSSQGGTNTFLKNNGAGGLSWATPTSYRNLVTLGADVANSLVTFADVTGLSFPVAANTKYRFYCLITFNAAATTTGAGWAVNGPAAQTLVAYKYDSSLTVGSQFSGSANTYDAGTVSTGSTATTGNIAVLEGALFNGANAGTLTVRFKSEIAASAITAKAGSTCEWW